MKNFKNILFTFFLAVVACYGQASMASTTLGAAITTTSQTTITLASTSTMLNPGPANRINTVLYVDKEFMWVQSVVDSTHVVVNRAKGIGASANATTHASGAKVYFAITTTSAPAPSYFKNEQNTAENYGSCSMSSELVLPRIYLFNGDIFDCKRTGAAGTGGQWILVGNGTMGTYGQRVSGFCTGTVGSAETTFLNGAACSGGTTATARQVITTAGTLANLRVFSSAAFLGTGGSILYVLKNGSNTAITCSPAAAATTCSDTTHSVAVVPGDVITFSFLSATSDTAANISAAVGLY